MKFDEMGTLPLYFGLVFASLITIVEMARCYNRCNWIQWSSWSDCDRGCAGGRQRRSREYCCKTELAHDIVLCMQDCGKDYNTMRSGFYDSKGCNEYCYNGGTYSPGTYHGYCKCPIRYRGTCCKDVVTCGRPATISHGTFTGNDFTYGGKINYSCDRNYNMTNTLDASRVCASSGSWTGKAPTCLYATSCNSSPCKNSAICENLLGDYRCLCNAGWAGKTCEVDVQSPIVHGCPLDRNITTSNLTSLQSWSEPNIIDPHGKHVIITKNYQHSYFEFPWGEFLIQYNAVKPSNGLRTECKFSISVKPFPCQKMDAPENGIILCNGWRKKYSQTCFFVCKKNYTLAPGYENDDIYVCGATGNWLPIIKAPRCVSQNLFPSKESGRFSSCTATSDRKLLSVYYIELLKKSAMSILCENHSDDCKPENVDIQC